MLVLGIESSCDETGVALYDSERGLIGHKLHSQISLHANYGGVVPELASRDHVRRLVPLINSLLDETGHTKDNLHSIACTRGPGLAGSLLVGITVAQAISYTLKKPIIEIHHLEAHLLSPLISNPEITFPFVSLLVSGGHTQLIKVENIGVYEILGDTRDDAAGEAFDKTAKLLGLPYPGGSALSKLASSGDPHRHSLPKPMIGDGSLDFSFSGLKTAVANLVHKLEKDKKGISEKIKSDIAASFEESVVSVLTHKCELALRKTGIQKLVVAGGVGANEKLRSTLTEKAQSGNFDVHYPPIEFCTDNGAMVALAGALKINEGKFGAVSFDVMPRWPLGRNET